MSSLFRVALTGDSFKNGVPVYPDFDLSLLKGTEGIEVVPFEEHRPEIGPDQLEGVQGVIVLTPAVSRASLARSEDLLVVSRFGVGFEKVDVAACTEANVVLCTAVGAVDRPVAEATVGWMIALSHNMRMKDRLVREGQWDRRSGFMGSELRGHTLGIVGLGGIGRTLVKLLDGFGMNRPLAFDPFLDAQAASELGVDLVELNELMEQADFVSVHCPLNEQTTNLISHHELSLMKPTAYLINTARGGIINEDALFEVLSSDQIAGAALDCFVGEPINSPHRFGELDNVILAPHSIAWTHELFRDIGSTASQSIIDLAQGRRPRSSINPEVFDRPSFQEKWERLKIDLM
ncbi:MAG: NAD(P)-dependent oxidoreductase [Verrucomicrobia bacterium]|nr:NAD(P)-dependent oxidoreductase [Verrucomicrobiota bacterium]